MSDPKPQQKKSFSPDWLVRGVLTRLGDTFDRLTGRGWKPSSSLATSELIERLKKLLDSEVRDIPGEGRFVPHNIKLKMQWDKFSTDADRAITKLEHELLTAAVDHINDSLYHTYAPLKLEIKPDYFTQGVKLLASFETFAEEDHEAEVNVTVPDVRVAGLTPEKHVEAVPEKETYIAMFSAGGGPKRVSLVFTGTQQLSVGRTAENNLAIDDHSVSKIHASLAVGAKGGLMVADTGSTNGTFINGERISYGKAYPVAEGNIVKFGLVDVVFEYVEKPMALSEDEDETHNAETIAIGEFEFRKRVGASDDQDTIPVPDPVETAKSPDEGEPSGEVESAGESENTGSPIPEPKTASWILEPINDENTAPEEIIAAARDDADPENRDDPPGSPENSEEGAR